MSSLATMPAVLPTNENAARIWNSGGAKYDCISRQIADAIEHCVDRLKPEVGEHVLDVATGTGWAARRIAARGARVMGVDICTTALNAARSLHDHGEIVFQLGDAEALPFEDASFDAVASTFGVMFCADPEAAASELARVCKPGGRMSLAVWDAKGGVHDMFRIMSKYKPRSANPDAPTPSPFDWSSELRLHELLGPCFDLRIERAVSWYREKRAEDAWRTFATAYGPMKKLVANLDFMKAAELRREFIEYHQQHATPAGILVPRDYLIITGIRK